MTEDRPSAEYTSRTPLGEPDNREPAVRVELSDGYWETMTLAEAEEFREEYEAAIERAREVEDADR